MFRLFDYARRLWVHGVGIFRRFRNRRQGHSTADNGNDALENRALKAIATNLQKNSRGRHIFDILTSVLRIATRDGAVRTYGGNAAGAAAVVAFKEQVCELIEVKPNLNSCVCGLMSNEDKNPRPSSFPSQTKREHFTRRINDQLSHSFASLAGNMPEPTSSMGSYG